WGIVWSRLAQQPGSSAEFLHTGCEWLRRAKHTRTSWLEVWRTMAALPEGRNEAWQAAGENWLEQQLPTLKEWPDILVQLLESGRCSRPVCQLARAWLAGHAVHARRDQVEKGLSQNC